MDQRSGLGTWGTGHTCIQAPGAMWPPHPPLVPPASDSASSAERRGRVSVGASRGPETSREKGFLGRGSLGRPPSRPHGQLSPTQPHAGVHGILSSSRPRSFPSSGRSSNPPQGLERKRSLQHLPDARAGANSGRNPASTPPSSKTAFVCPRSAFTPFTQQPWKPTAEAFLLSSNSKA